MKPRNNKTEYADNRRQPTMNFKKPLNVEKLVRAKKADFELMGREETEEDLHFTPKEVYPHLRDVNREAESEFEEMAKEMTNVLEDGGVKKKIIESGDGDQVGRGFQVKISYNAYLEGSDEPYDSTYIRATHFRFILVNDFYNTPNGFEVLPGLDAAVASMKKGEKADFLIQPAYAYGSAGALPRVPRNATLLFKIHLVHCEELPGKLKIFFTANKDERRTLPFDIIMAVFNYRNDKAKRKFAREDYDDAEYFFRGCKYVLDEATLHDERDEEEKKRLWLKTVKNIAVCNIKLEDFKKVLVTAEEGLGADPTNANFLYCKGKALRNLGKLEEARDALRAAHHFKPCDTDIAKELHMLDESMRAQHLANKKMCKQMFAGPKEKKPEKEDSAKKDENEEKTEEEKEEERKEKERKEEERKKKEEEERIILGMREDGVKLTARNAGECTEVMLQFMEDYLEDDELIDPIFLPCNTFPNGAIEFTVSRGRELGLAVDRMMLAEGGYGIRFAKPRKPLEQQGKKN